MEKQYFVFNGIDSRTFGITCDGAQAFNGPERDITKVSIPGRTGDLFYDNGRWLNQELVYHCFIDKRRFQEKIPLIRKWLCGSNGYLILKDSYNPGIFRRARYVGPLEITPYGIGNHGAEFDIKFDTDPRKFIDGIDLVDNVSYGTINVPEEFQEAIVGWEPWYKVANAGSATPQSMQVYVDYRIVEESSGQIHTLTSAYYNTIRIANSANMAVVIDCANHRAYNADTKANKTADITFSGAQWLEGLDFMRPRPYRVRLSGNADKTLTFKPNFFTL